MAPRPIQIEWRPIPVGRRLSILFQLSEAKHPTLDLMVDFRIGPKSGYSVEPSVTDVHANSKMIFLASAAR